MMTKLPHWLLISFWLSLVISGVVLANTEETPDAEQLLMQASQSTHFRFHQEKELQGMPRPLISGGYLELSSESLLWVTEHPVAHKILVGEQGIQEFTDQQYQQVEGTELIGQLLLALLNRDTNYLQQFFKLSARENCVELTPIAEPLSTFYTQIKVCGTTEIEQVILHEQGGNKTDIRLEVVEG